MRKFNDKSFINSIDAVKWILQNFQISVSGETIRKLLRLHGLKCYNKIKKPALNSKHIKNRLYFARELKNLTFNDWEKYLFSDESKFNLHGSDGETKV